MHKHNSSFPARNHVHNLSDGRKNRHQICETHDIWENLCGSGCQGTRVEWCCSTALPTHYFVSTAPNSNSSNNWDSKQNNWDFQIYCNASPYLASKFNGVEVLLMYPLVLQCNRHQSYEETEQVWADFATLAVSKPNKRLVFLVKFILPALLGLRRR